MAAVGGHALRPGSSTPAGLHRHSAEHELNPDPLVNLSSSYQALPTSHITPNESGNAIHVQPYQGLQPSAPNAKSVSSLWIGDLYCDKSQESGLHEDVPRVVVDSPLQRSYATVQRVLTDAANVKAQELGGKPILGHMRHEAESMEHHQPVSDSYIMNRLYQSARPATFRSRSRSPYMLRSSTPRSYASLEDLLKETAVEKAQQILKEDALRQVADSKAHRNGALVEDDFAPIPEAEVSSSSLTGENHFQERRDTWFPKSTVGKPRKELKMSDAMKKKLDELTQAMDDLEAAQKVPGKETEALTPLNLASMQASLSSLRSLRNVTPAAEQSLLAAPKPTHLANMAPTKNFRYSAQAVEASKETCEYCRRPIGGYYSVTALGRHWHSNHLRCFECRKVLGDLTFYHLDKRLYCTECWTDKHSLPCEQCRQPILETCIEAVGKLWHPEHFQCAQCAKVLTFGTPYIEHKNRAYCEEDYYNLFSPMCAKCDQAIKKDIVFALGKSWHPPCLGCMTCNKSLADGTFFDLHGASYCEEHYHEVKGSICSACNQPIIGKCLNVMGRKYHTEHFVCSFCSVALGKMGFKEGPGDKPYCLRCHANLFSKS